MKSTFLHGRVISIIVSGLLFTTLFAPYAIGHEIVGWGNQKLPNAPLNNLKKIAAGGYYYSGYSLALKSDGSIVGWGDNVFGAATPPAGNNFIAIAAGSDHGLALKSDGSIIGWGCNYNGQMTPPAGNNFTAIATGYSHSLALKSDGSIVGWGDNDYGQATPPAGNNFVAIAAGSDHSLALKSDGSIVAWGDNLYGQATPPAGNNFVAIAAGWYHNLALKSDGTIVGWGSNTYWMNEWAGQATPPAGNNFIAIAAGVFHSLAIKSDGSIVGWGYNGYGQATHPSGNDFTAVAAGGTNSLALKSDGSTVGWGAIDTPLAGNNFIAIAAGGAHHSLALKSDGSIIGWWQATPPAGNNFAAIAAGEYHSLALKSDGSIVGWGNNDDGQATPPAGNNYTAIAAGWSHSLALKSDGSIAGWGYNGDGRATPPAGNDYLAIAAGGSHSLALKSDGSIVGWGNNSNGQATPPAGNDFLAIAAGYAHSLALKSDGSIVGWGWNYNINGQYVGQATPPAGNNFIAIAAGDTHSLALKSDGSIVGWGDNTYGQATPQAGNNYTAVAAGYQFSLALRSPQAGDINGDYKVNMPDFALLANQWLRSDCETSNNWCLDADIDQNNSVDLNDLKVLADNWLAGVVNNSPVVNAGNDQAITLPADANLAGASVTDDGLPNPPGAVTTHWTVTSGPNSVTFADVNAVHTTASFAGSGVYVLRLTANDGALSAYDEVQITVQQNQPPDVNAGLDQTILLPADANICGTVTDDGLPNPPGAVTVTWTKQSGPGTVTFGDIHAVDTTASFSMSGTYVLRLTASDSVLSSYDEVTVIVSVPPSCQFVAGTAAGWNLGDGSVLLQTIYGTAQDSSGNITANTTRALSQNKGEAMAFNVAQDMVLSTGWFKLTGVKSSCTLRVRLFNVTGRGYLTYNHTGITKADPGGSGNPALIDVSQSTGGSVPSHSEGTQVVTDLIVNFGSLPVTAGDYFITFDATTGSNTLGSMVRGVTTDITNMTTYPDGSSLPKRATVTTSSFSTGNTYHYELASTSDTTYTPRSYLTVFQITTDN